MRASASADRLVDADRAARTAAPAALVALGRLAGARDDVDAAWRGADRRATRRAAAADAGALVHRADRAIRRRSSRCPGCASSASRRPGCRRRAPSRCNGSSCAASRSSADHESDGLDRYARAGEALSSPRVSTVRNDGAIRSRSNSSLLRARDLHQARGLQRSEDFCSQGELPARLLLHQRRITDAARVSGAASCCAVGRRLGLVDAGARPPRRSSRAGRRARERIRFSCEVMSP